MAIWMVRAGSDGEHEQLALEKNQVVISFSDIGDLSGASTREDIKQRIMSASPDIPEGRLNNWAGQLHAFKNRITPNDIIAVPLKSQPAIAFARPIGDYEYKPENPVGARHTRPVQWIRTDVPRSAFDKDLLYSFGAFMTVCQIKRNNAEERIRAVLENRLPVPPPLDAAEEQEASDESVTLLDLEGYARDLIRERINERFKTHRFERLIEEILRAEGYSTERTGQGPDGGVDIVAGVGKMGFDEPRLAVQVKSGGATNGTKEINQLQGAMTNFAARQGLFVSWGGYSNPALALKRQLFFKIRLWDADDVIDALLANYDRLPDDIKTEIPLKRIWTLVVDETES